MQFYIKKLFAVFGIEFLDKKNLSSPSVQKALMLLSHKKNAPRPRCARSLAVATHEQLVSKSFQGRHGRAYLFTTATNVMLGPKEERVLMTSATLPTALTLLIAWVTSSIFMFVYSMAIDTILLCFCEDVSRNKNGGIMFASKSLQKVVGHVPPEVKKYRQLFEHRLDCWSLRDLWNHSDHS